MTRSDLLPYLLTKDIIFSKQRFEFLDSSHIIYIWHVLSELSFSAASTMKFYLCSWTCKSATINPSYKNVVNALVEVEMFLFLLLLLFCSDRQVSFSLLTLHIRRCTIFQSSAKRETERKRAHCFDGAR